MLWFFRRTRVHDCVPGRVTGQFFPAVKQGFPACVSRVSGKDDAIRLTPPRVMTLEQAIAYIDDDEMVEVTPKSIRLRKAILDPNERKKAGRKKEAA